MGYTTGHKWNKNEEQYLRENYIDKTDLELSKHLGVSKNSVGHKLTRLGLLRSKDISRRRATEASVKATKKEKIIVVCVECGKPLPPLLPCFAKVRKFCSKSCGSKYSQLHPTEGAINHRKNFGVRVAKHPKRLEGIRKVAQREGWLINRTGEKNPRWLGGISFEPYSREFNKRVKKHVRILWQNTCFLCKKTSDLTVHHIDYNKKNNSIYNFVILCRACNSRVNTNREYWQKYLHGVCWGSPEEKNLAESIYNESLHNF